MPKQTGQGAIVSLVSSGQVACARNVTLPNLAVESIDASCLDSTGFTSKISGDLIDAGEVTVTAIFDPDDTWMVPQIGVTDTLTITIKRKGGGTDATFLASGFVSAVQLPTLGLNELMEQEFTFTLDGLSQVPAFTPSAAA